MGEKIHIRINGTTNGMYLNSHREIINRSIGKVILVEEWDANYYVASVVKLGATQSSPILIAKDDCTKME